MVCNALNYLIVYWKSTILVKIHYWFHDWIVLRALNRRIDKNIHEMCTKFSKNWPSVNPCSVLFSLSFRRLFICICNNNINKNPKQKTYKKVAIYVFAQTSTQVFNTQVLLRKNHACIVGGSAQTHKHGFWCKWFSGVGECGKFWKFLEDSSQKVQRYFFSKKW